ncbi:MAG: hypothetical protein ACI92B_002638, partial [Marinobacter maritimus]
RNVTGQSGAQIRLMGQNLGITGHQQNVIKCESFFGNSQHWDQPFERAKFKPSARHP